MQREKMVKVVRMGVTETIGFVQCIKMPEKIGDKVRLLSYFTSA
jgi:hypothetical protein